MARLLFGRAVAAQTNGAYGAGALVRLGARQREDTAKDIRFRVQQYSYSSNPSPSNPRKARMIRKQSFMTYTRLTSGRAVQRALAALR